MTPPTMTDERLREIHRRLSMQHLAKACAYSKIRRELKRLIRLYPDGVPVAKITHALKLSDRTASKGQG